MTPTSHGGLPMFDKLILSGRRPFGSERRALGLQELGLLGRSLPAQDLVPVREPPEPLDDVSVRDGVPGGCERRLVCGVGASVATEHVAGELVEHDDECQAAPCIVAPAVEVAGCGLLVETGELVRDPGVELGVFAEPLVAKLAVARLACAAEPEVEYFVGLTRHGLLPLRLRRDG